MHFYVFFVLIVFAVNFTNIILQVHVITKKEVVCDVLSKKMLPPEYGGDGPSLDEIAGKVYKELKKLEYYN